MVFRPSRSLEETAAEIDADRTKQIERGVRSLQAVLTARQMLRFLQAELKVDALVDFVLAVAVPFEEGE